MIQHKFNDGGRADAGFKGRTGDCVVRSIAIAAQLDYKYVYDEMANINANSRKTKRSVSSTGKRTARDGVYTNRKAFKDWMHAHGFTWHATMTIGSGCTTHLRPDELPSGRIVCVLSRHFAAVIDGVLHDTYDCSRRGTRCVYGYWKLEG